MKKIIKSISLVTAILGILLTTLIVQAGGWANFKLRYYYLTSYLHHHKDSDNWRKQNLDLEKSSRIDLNELLNGGPPKDGIPSIDRPQFDNRTTTPFSPTNLVIGVVVNGEAKAYPLGIMNWHEIVNDRVAGLNITVTYCPLCDTIVAFERKNTTYGVSGKLYQSCLVMYDRSDDTLYSQPWAMGVVGKKVNHHLTRIPAVKTTLAAWLKQYPDSKILATNTGYNRDYQSYPYGTYYTNERIIFPVRNQAKVNLHPKDIVSYIWQPDEQITFNKFSGVSHQFVHDEIKKMGEKTVEFNGEKVRAYWQKNLETVIIQNSQGELIPSSTAFAFVYPAYFGEK